MASRGQGVDLTDASIHPVPLVCADLAHAHAAGGPFGFDPAAAECDRAVVEAVRESAPTDLLGRVGASDDALGSACTVVGALARRRGR